MKIIFVLLIILISTPAYAGMTWEKVKEALQIVNVRDDDELIYILKDLRKTATVGRDTTILAHKVNELMVIRENHFRIVNRVFDARFEQLKIEKDIEKAKTLSYEIYQDFLKEVKVASTPADIEVVYAVMNDVFWNMYMGRDPSRNIEDLSMIVDSIRLLREHWNKYLSIDHRKRLLEAANTNDYKAILKIVDIAIVELRKGSVFVCSSEPIMEALK